MSLGAVLCYWIVAQRRAHLLLLLRRQHPGAGQRGHSHYHDGLLEAVLRVSIRALYSQNYFDVYFNFTFSLSIHCRWANNVQGKTHEGYEQVIPCRADGYTRINYVSGASKSSETQNSTAASFAKEKV